MCNDRGPRRFDDTRIPDAHDERERWRTIIAHLSAEPTEQRDRYPA